MKHLFEIFHEPIFDYQMRIWSVLAYNNFVNPESKKIKLKDYNFSMPVEKINENLNGINIA